MAGLGTLAYEHLGFRKVVTLGEQYSYPFAQVGAFVLQFCAAGGKIVERLWVPLMTEDYSHILDAIPDDADAILLALGGTDAIKFLEQYRATGKKKAIIGGVIAAVTLFCVIMKRYFRGSLGEDFRTMFRSRKLRAVCCVLVLVGIGMIPITDRAGGEFVVRALKREEVRSPVAGFLHLPRLCCA